MSEADNVKRDERYKCIDIEVLISISTLLWQSIDIGIDDTFKAGIDIEYRRYFWKISITTLILVTSSRGRCYTKRLRERPQTAGAVIRTTGRCPVVVCPG